VVLYTGACHAAQHDRPCQLHRAWHMSNSSSYTNGCNVFLDNIVMHAMWEYTCLRVRDVTLTGMSGSLALTAASAGHR
jgi:hypothetical protein